ncbi:L,D-transpeptidase family protein [Sphingomonas sp. LHG3406-1]|uniref:L,D-transpeptidase family protein n=1 Tax=Sphingomonas sp. LHG3406-1 TaxID=2804617 RepID=UPI0026059BCA|nr:L,D-transpeptidase family protein [Sphingomonas sp. LHG3406-1]
MFHRSALRFAPLAVAAALLASCATAPQRSIAPPPPVAEAKLPYEWTHGHAPKATKEARALFGTVALTPGQYRWAATIPDAPAKVVIDRLQQLMFVYKGDTLVGVSTISSGKKGKESPLGYWKVFRKQVKGFSRKYDNAPMPYMQMYDEKGIAFHGGALPGYPASRGCVRLPVEFAKKLYGLTTMGTEVVIEG